MGRQLVTAALVDAPGSANRGLAGQKLAAMKAKGAINAQPYNGAMSDAQFAWLEQTLAKAQASGEKAIVMGHYPIFPFNLDANMLDDVRLVETLGRFPNVVAYLNGHHHPGNYGETGGKHFVNFCGMVDTPDTTAQAIAGRLSKAQRAICERCGIDLDSGADCGIEPYPCLGSEQEIETEYGRAILAAERDGGEVG